MGGRRGNGTIVAASHRWSAVNRRRPAGACLDVDRSFERELDAPSVKPRLAALRHLFDWLVNGQVVPVNPAHTVRGLRHVVRGGKTPVTDGAAGRRPPGI
jgi:site-specific recombinase XerC